MLRSCACLATCCVLSVNAQTANQTTVDTFPIKPIGLASDTQEGRFNGNMGYFYNAENTNFTSLETLASRDVHHHWGASSNELKISVWFKKNEFLSGDSIICAVLVRNVGNTAKTLLVSDKMWQFTLRHGTNIIKWQRTADDDFEKTRVDNGVFTFQIDPKTDGLLAAHINRFFPLTETGDYSIQVEMRVQAPNTRSAFSIVSGEARFSIVDKLSPSQQ